MHTSQLYWSKHYTHLKTVEFKFHSKFMNLIRFNDSIKFIIFCWHLRVLSDKQLPLFIHRIQQSFIFVLSTCSMHFSFSWWYKNENFMCHWHVLNYLLKSRMRRRRAGVDILLEHYLSVEQFKRLRWLIWLE